MINICIPTLNSYKTLRTCLGSIKNSSVKVDGIYVIDNGGNYKNMDNDVTVIPTPFNWGVAKSWNWFIQNIPEDRIICNDDIEFFPDSIKTLIENKDDSNIIYPISFGVNSFSCFLLPQTIVDVVGLFDEKISPNYAYFEDNDYHRRMLLAGFDIKGIQTDVIHVGSSTLNNLDPAQINAHHERFRIARSNYIKKWGGEPGEEKFEVPVNL